MGDGWLDMVNEWEEDVQIGLAGTLRLGGEEIGSCAAAGCA